MVARICLVCSATLAPAPDLAGEIDRVVVDDDVAHARSDIDAADGHVLISFLSPVCGRASRAKPVGRQRRNHSLELVRQPSLPYQLTGKP